MTPTGWRCALLVGLGSLATAPAAAQRKGPVTAVIVRGPEVGSRAPDFSLPSAVGDTVGAEPFVLSRALGRVVVLVFYPRDFTRSSSAEWQSFVEQRESLFGADVTVVGISPDSLETHRRFSASMGLPFPLLSDPDQAVAKRYGADAEPGYNRRALFVIGKDGRVRWRDYQFNALDPDEHEALRTAIGKASRS
ncbi:MAG: peroxiredoxin [Gemmatimonadales bacterium]|nr:peroxiredoxin [Gemmatimonadales bacterium]